jgi:hypothetical protein
MAVNLSPVGGVAAQFFTSTGAVLTGGKLYTYAAGTTTPAATYTSSNGLTAWTNPVVLDAAGRVPGSGEIWLTDGVVYKFVLKDSNDVLIATYDNVTGINSNSVSYTNQQEIVTATAGQTVFDLSISYQPGTNSLSVFVDGVNQYGPGASYSYVETDSNTVTFNSGLHVGAEVKFTTTQQQGAGAVDASQVSYDPPFTNSVATNVESRLANFVLVTDFGATCDGTTDDSAAVQAAVNYCLSFNGAKTLIVPGKCRLASSIIINRLVDTTSTRFRIIGEGSDAGFYTTTNVVMFDTTLPVTTDPQSENISFEGVTFSTDNNTRNTFVLAAGKFLRMQFINCDFQLIRCMYSTVLYAQTYHFYQCRARYWLDYFFSSSGAYDFHAEIDMKGGGTGFRLLSATRPVLRADLTDCTFEGCSGSFITAGDANGLTIANNYIEYNGSVALNFDNGYSNSTITVSGNTFVQTAPQIADPNYYDIQWGQTTRAVSFGNYCNGKLHNTSKITGADRLLTISGDYAAVELYKGFGNSLYDPARNAVGNVALTVNNRQVLSIGNNWTGIDADFGGTNLGPGVVQNGAYVPVRLISGNQNPGTNNAYYGNPYWTVGSVVTNSAPAVGSPKGWVCTVSGQPGTWVSQGNL